MLTVPSCHTDVRRSIYSHLTTQLSRTWCHYLFLQRDADSGNAKLLTTWPSDPVPGRRLLIVRDDNMPAPLGTSLSFDALMAASAEPSAYQQYSSLNSLSRSSTVVERQRSPSPAPKRWGLLKNMMPFGGPGKTDEPLRVDTKVDPVAASKKGISPSKSSNNSTPDPSTPATPNPAKPVGSFKFSLEWSERAGAPPSNQSRNRKLHPPRLPHTAQSILRSMSGDEPRYAPRAPAGLDVGPSKYTGRALAEWWLLLLECQNFYERRKAEGVTNLKAVETPTLTVENFRKPIGG